MQQRRAAAHRQPLCGGNVPVEKNRVAGQSSDESIASRCAKGAQGSKAAGRRIMVESLIAWLIVGAIAGWLAGLIVKGYGFGLIGNIVVGIIGAVIAGYILPRLGIGLGVGMVAAIINAVIGAVVLLVIIGLVRKVT
jgi:uncharacterized membrane protein YeaQ/YmgE (transglycosylase-associated protein family)